jgi:hypothetical protein
MDELTDRQCRWPTQTFLCHQQVQVRLEVSIQQVDMVYHSSMLQTSAQELQCLPQEEDYKQFD